MNYLIDQAISELDKVKVSRFEYPAGSKDVLDPAGCCFLASLIRVSNARKVLEYGSGFSSLMIARELENKKGAFLFSVDSSEKYSKNGSEVVAASCSGIRCEFRRASVRPHIYNKRLLLGYGLTSKELKKRGCFDLVSIDIPAYNRCICESAVYEAFEVLKPGGFIVIGNANSADPRDKKWKKLFGNNAVFHYLDGLGDGIAVIEKLKDGKPAPLGFSSGIAESCRTLKFAWGMFSGKYN